MLHEDGLALFERSDWTSSKLTRCDWLNGHRELRTVTVPRILTHFRGESGGQKTERKKRRKGKQYKTSEEKNENERQRTPLFPWATMRNNKYIQGRPHAHLQIGEANGRLKRCTIMEVTAFFFFFFPQPTQPPSLVFWQITVHSLGAH